MKPEISLGSRIVCLLALWPGGSALSQDNVATRSSVPTKNATETYSVDLETSRIYVRVAKSTRLGHSHAVTGRILSGEISLDGPAPGGEFEFDVTSFRADESKARQFVRLGGTVSESDRRKVTETMLGPKVLDVARFPTAKFTIKEIVASETDVGQYKISGEFLLHGVSRNLEVTAKAEPNENQLHLQGYFKIKQTDFGIQPYQVAAGLIAISDTLKVWADLRLVRTQ